MKIVHREQGKTPYAMSWMVILSCTHRFPVHKSYTKRINIGDEFKCPYCG